MVPGKLLIRHERLRRADPRTLWRHVREDALSDRPELSEGLFTFLLRNISLDLSKAPSQEACSSWYDVTTKISGGIASQGLPRQKLKGRE